MTTTTSAPGPDEPDPALDPQMHLEDHPQDDEADPAAVLPPDDEPDHEDMPHETSGPERADGRIEVDGDGPHADGEDRDRDR